MLKSNRRLKHCGRITAIVILVSFLTTFPVYGEQPTALQPNLTERETKRYSDSEVALLIDEISEAAYEAIEQAAGEAARAAVLSVLEREATSMREASLLRAEVSRWRTEAESHLKEVQAVKSAGRKNTFLAALIGIFGGLALGVSGTMLMRN